MSLSHTEWTADMLDDIPDDGNRYEVIDGELFVTPAPENVHQRAVAELVVLLLPYAKRVGFDLLIAPSTVRFSTRREVQPDVLATPRMPDGSLPDRFADTGKLLLAVEVLSPSSMRTDRFKKRALYQDERVPDYWIVDTASRVIECWTPDASEPEYQSSELLWQPVPEHAPLVINVARYFREVFGE